MSPNHRSIDKNVKLEQTLNDFFPLVFLEHYFFLPFYWGIPFWISDYYYRLVRVNVFALAVFEFCIRWIFSLFLFFVPLYRSRNIHSGRIFLINGLYLSASKQSLYNVQIMNKKKIQSVFPMALFFFRNSDIFTDQCVLISAFYVWRTNDKRSVSDWKKKNGLNPCLDKMIPWKEINISNFEWCEIRNFVRLSCARSVATTSNSYFQFDRCLFALNN